MMRKITYQVDVWMPISPPWFADLDLCDMGTSMTYGGLNQRELTILLEAVRVTDSDSTAVVTAVAARAVRRWFDGGVCECLAFIEVVAAEEKKRRARARARR